MVAAAVLFVPCGYSVAQFLVYPRCDAWLALFALASLYFLMSPELSVKSIVWGALFAALALFTKQTALFGICAVTLHLLIARRRKGAWTAAATVGFCLGFLALSYWRFGPAMLESMFSLTVRRQFLLSRFAALIVPEMVNLSVLLGIAVMRMAYHAFTRTWDLLDSYLLAMPPLAVSFCSMGAALIISCQGIWDSCWPRL